MDLNLHSIRLTYYCRSHLCTTLTLQGGYTLGTKFLYTYFSFMQAGVHAHTHTHTHDQRYGWVIVDYVRQLHGTHDIVCITEMCSCLV